MSKTSSLTITLNSQDVANNTSDITVKGIIKCDSGSYRNNKTLNYYIMVNGTKVVNVSTTADAKASTTNTMFSKRLNVSHNSSGACTVKAHFDFCGDWVSETTTKTLTSIPQAATLTSVSNTTAGGSCTYKFTPRNTTYKYKITFSCGGITGETDFITPTSTDPVSGTFEMTVANWHRAIPNAKTGTVTATLRTYNGNTQVGSASSKTFTLTANPNYLPTISDVSKLIINGYSTFYLKNRSSVKVATTASIKYGNDPEPSDGATIASYAVTIGDTVYTSTSNEVTSNVLAGDSYEVFVTVTDTRGNTATSSSTFITTVAYEAPVITGNIFRCDANNNPAPTIGERIRINLEKSCTDISGLSPANSVSWYSIEYIKGSDTTPTVVSPIPNIPTTLTQDGNTGFSAKDKYVFTVKVRDTVGTETKATFTVPSAFMLLHFNKDGHGMAIGGGNTVDHTIQAHLPLRTKYGITYDNGGGFYNSADNVEGYKFNPARLTSANIAPTGIAGMTHFLVTQNMTEGKPANSNGNGHIINFEWDNYGTVDKQTNTGGACYSSQLFIPHSSVASKHMAFRATGGANRYVSNVAQDPWTNVTWKELIDTGGGQTIGGNLAVSGVLTVGGYRLLCMEKTCSCTANTTTSTAITWTDDSNNAVTFTEVPKVMVSAKTQVPGETVIGVGFSDVTTTGCKIYVRRTNNTNTVVSVWVWGKVS